ncbi:Variable surface protein Vir14-related [Plasmodium coatneyi]|uniref:Variable surface protein Vir14-related n=1 Tax=Plasmodium coatneyi TaxID=208452 RepID=A0A1B1E2J6_9APIC|nr:Variable surface protein Vir14-related [Plasmodium coatneyi]ANQ09223.1 Variable surface protein Vir14-related [Plasmodium coatneyi]
MMFNVDFDNTTQVEADVDAISENTIKSERIIFKHLPSYLFEEKLKEHSSTNEYITYFNRVNDLKSEYSWLTDIFNKLSRNISLMQNSYVQGDDFNKKRCYDLNYWLYNEVYKNLNASEQNTKHWGDIVRRVQEVWRNIVDKEFYTDEHRCYPDDQLLLHMGYLQEIKDIFDFFEDYNQIKKEIIANTSKACRKYVDYLKQRIPLYYTWKDSCAMDASTCKRYIDNYSKYRPLNVINSLNKYSLMWSYFFNDCYKEVYNLFVEATKQPKRNDSIYKKKIDMLEESNTKSNLPLIPLAEKLRVNELSVAHDHNDYGFREQWPVYKDRAYRILRPMLGTVGVFLILYTLYKFMSLGRILRHRRAKRKKRRIGPAVNYDDIMLLYQTNESLTSSSRDNSSNNSSSSNSRYSLSYASSVI